MAVDAQHGEGGSGAVHQGVALGAGGLGGDAAAGFVQLAAQVILHQAIFRDHQRQAAIDDGLRGEDLFQVPDLGKTQLKGDAGALEPLVPKICKRAGIEYIQPEIAHHLHPRLPSQGEVADITCGNGCNAFFLYGGEMFQQFIFIPVPPNPGQNSTPLGVGFGQGVHLGEDLHGNIHPGGAQIQQLLGDLLSAHHGNRKFRRAGGPVGIGKGGGLKAAAPRRRDARLRQGLQSFPAQCVDGAGRKGQALLHLRLDAEAPVRRAAGLSQAAFDLFSGDGTVPGGLGNTSANGDFVTLAVCYRQGNRLTCRNAADHMDSHILTALFFVHRSCGVKKLFGFRGIFRTGAEHPGTPFALPVPVRKTGAGEGFLQFLFLGGGGSAVFLQEGGINAGDDSNILRPLHAALQLQTGNAHGGHVLQLTGQAAVLQAQGILFSRLAVHTVGQAAGLGAAAPVTGASSDQGAHGALAGIAHTKGAVDKDLDFCGAVFDDGFGVLPGAFPGDDHPLAPIRGGLAGAAAGEYAHLGAGVEGEVGKGFAQQVEKAPILDQNGVDAQLTGLGGGFRGLGKLPVRDQSVQGEEYPHPTGMTIAQRLPELLVGEILGAASGIKFTPAQIYRVGSVLNGSPKGLRGSGGGEKLGPHQPIFPSFCCRRKTSRFSSLTSAWALPAASR